MTKYVTGVDLTIDLIKKQPLDTEVMLLVENVIIKRASCDYFPHVPISTPIVTQEKGLISRPATIFDKRWLHVAYTPHRPDYADEVDGRAAYAMKIEDGKYTCLRWFGWHNRDKQQKITIIGIWI